jgi:acetoacetate decarboxylase
MDRRGQSARGLDAPSAARLRGRLDVHRLASNQPASGPLYPGFPRTVYDSRSLAVVYETDLDPVLARLPPELAPATDPPQVVCVSNVFGFGMAGGGYSEMNSLIPVSYEGETHIYPWVVYLGEGTEEWFAAGRELLGDNKKLARITFEQQLGRGMVRACAERPAGHPIQAITVGPFDRQCAADEFAYAPVIGIRLLPSALGEDPQIAELTRKRAPITLRGASDGSAMIFAGPATVVHGASSQDPLYELPVRRVLAGYYMECGTVDELDAEVLGSYLGPSVNQTSTPSG